MRSQNYYINKKECSKIAQCWLGRSQKVPTFFVYIIILRLHTNVGSYQQTTSITTSCQEYRGDEEFTQVRKIGQNMSLSGGDVIASKGSVELLTETWVCKTYLGEICSHRRQRHLLWGVFSLWKEMVKHRCNQILAKNLHDLLCGPLEAVPPSKRNAHILSQLHTRVATVVHHLRRKYGR